MSCRGARARSRTVRRCREPRPTELLSAGGVAGAHTGVSHRGTDGLRDRADCVEVPVLRVVTSWLAGPREHSKWLVRPSFFVKSGQRRTASARGALRGAQVFTFLTQRPSRSVRGPGHRAWSSGAFGHGPCASRPRDFLRFPMGPSHSLPLSHPPPQCFFRYVFVTLFLKLLELCND